MKLLSIIAIAVYALPISGCRSAGMPDTDSGKTHSKPEEARPVQVIARRFWQPKKQVLSLVRPMEQPECITIHHDGKSNYGRDWKASARRIRELQEGDIQAGHGDIRCHFIIDREGLVWEGRSIRSREERDRDSIGVMLLGDFEKQTMNEQQKLALTELLDHLCAKYRIPAADVQTHRELSGVVCPGRQVQTFVQIFRASRLRSVSEAGDQSHQTRSSQ